MFVEKLKTKHDNFSEKKIRGREKKKKRIDPE